MIIIITKFTEINVHIFTLLRVIRCWEMDDCLLVISG